MTEAVILVVFPFAMVHAAISDMLSMTIINRVSLLLIGAFLLVAPATGMPWSDFSMHLATLALLLGVCFTFFAVGAMGGGDAKLIASTSLWFGFSFQLMEYLLVSSVLGGILTISILSYRRSPIAVYASQVGFLRRLADPKEKIPYGIALGIGGLLAFPDSVLATWVIERLSGY